VVAHEFQPHPQWRHAPQRTVVRLDLRTARRRHPWRASCCRARHRPGGIARMVRALSCSPPWQRWCWATSAWFFGRPLAGGRVAAIANSLGRRIGRAVSRENPVGLSGAPAENCRDWRRFRGLVTPESRRSGAHVVRRRSSHACFPRNPPIEERLKALDPFVPCQRIAEARGRRPRRRLGSAGAPDGRRASTHFRSGRREARARSRQPATAAFADTRAQNIAALAGTIANENVRYAENGARCHFPEGLRDFRRLPADHARPR